MLLLRLNKGRNWVVYKVGVEDMMCEHCVKAVKGALEKIPGVVSADVSLEQKGAVVSADRALSEEEVTEAIKAEDYEVTSFEAISTPEEIVSIKIEGMTCEHCVKRLQSTFLQLTAHGTVGFA